VTPTVASAAAHVTVALNGGAPAAVASGSASAPLTVPAVGGSATISVVVAAEDGGTRTYAIALTQAGADDATLSALAVSGGSLTTAFAPATTSYSVVAPHGAASVSITPTANDANATVTVAVNGGSASSVARGGSASVTVPAVNGSTAIALVVTAQDGVTTRTYAVTLTQAPSSDPSLSGLAVSAGSLKPAFATGTLGYDLAVPFGTQNVTLTPTATDAGAIVAVSVNSAAPSPLLGGHVSVTVPPVGGSASVAFVVTAQDSLAQRTYTVTLTQSPSGDASLSALAVSGGTLTPDFPAATSSYAVVAPHGASTIDVTPTATSAAATLTLALNLGTPADILSGDTAHIPVPSVGDSTTISIVVTAQDRSTTRSYSITLTQAASNDATLANLAVDAGTLTPAFTAAEPSYAVTAPWGTASVGVATITIAQNGGQPVSATSGSPASVPVPPVGSSTTISIVVLAQDLATTQTYTVKLAQDPGDDAALSGLTLGGASPRGFSPATLAYAFGVPNGTSSVPVVATPRDSLANVSINGLPANGGAAVPVALAGGAATVTVVVTARNGTTQATYTVSVSEAPQIGLASARQVSMDPSPLLTVAAGALLPGSAATDVPADTLLRIGFDDAPALGTAGTITICLSDGTVVDRIDLADSWAVYDGTAAGPTSKVFTTNSASSKVNVIGNVAAGIEQVRVVNYVPVTVSGNTAVIFPHNNRLSYGVTYYVTIDPGVLTGTIGGVSFGGIAPPSPPTDPGWSFTTKLTKPTGLHVAADNSADFATVQGAIDAVGLLNRAATTISVDPGVYQELLWIRNKWNITIQGTDNGVGTVIQYDNCDGFNPGTGGGQAVTKTGSTWTIPTTNRASGGRSVLLVGSTDGLVLDAITLKNTHGHRTFALPDGTTITGSSSPTFVNYSSGVTQAETIYFNAGNATQRLVAKHANFVSHQDTLQLKGFSWFYDCFVAGDVDFIWGNANAALFEQCELRTQFDTSGPSVVQSRAVGGYPGFVFLNSALTRDDGPAYDAYLARSPGNPSAGSNYDAVAFVNCSMDTHIDPLGWNATGSNPTGSNQVGSAVAGWREYGSRLPSGDFVDVSGRLPPSSALGKGPAKLSDSDVGTFFSSRAAVFGCTNNGTIGWTGYGATTGTCPGTGCSCPGWNPVP